MPPTQLRARSSARRSLERFRVIRETDRGGSRRSARPSEGYSISPCTNTCGVKPVRSPIDSPWPMSLTGMPVFSCTASTKPPFAEPSSLVSTRPVTPACSMKASAWLSPFWPGRRIQHQEHLGDRRLLLDHPADLRQLIHQSALGLQATGGVDEHDLDAVVLRLLDGLECDGCRVLAGMLRPHDLRSAALGPVRELLDGGRAEGVGGADDDAATVVGEELRELADGRGLADAVDTDDEHDRGTVAQEQGRVEFDQAFLEVFAQHPLEVDRVGGAVLRDAGAQVLDDRVGDVGAEVGRDQGVFEVFPGLLVDSFAREHAAQGAGQRPRWCHAASLGGRPCHPPCS